MVAYIRDAPTPPFWHKTAATSTAPAVVFLPPGVRSIKVYADVASYLAFGTTVTAPTVGAANAVQTITTIGTPTGGTFGLRFRGVSSTAIQYNDSAANIDAILEALTTIGTAGVVTAGGALPTAVTVTFSGTLFAGIPVPLIEVASEALTGGTNPHVLVRMTTDGANPYSYVEGGTQELFSLDEDVVSFLYVAAVTGTGNYRVSAYR